MGIRLVEVLSISEIFELHANGSLFCLITFRGPGRHLKN
jgi:hypothetical protein